MLLELCLFPLLPLNAGLAAAFEAWCCAAIATDAALHRTQNPSASDRTIAAQDVLPVCDRKWSSPRQVGSELRTTPIAVKPAIWGDTNSSQIPDPPNWRSLLKSCQTCC